MNRFAKIIMMLSNYLAEVSGIGGTTRNRFISPKGLYSKPLMENAVVIPLSGGNSQDVIIALQKDVSLNDGDVIVTDDTNYIHFKQSAGKIEIKGDTIFNDNVTINGTLDVMGAITAASTVTISGAVTAASTVMVTGPVTAASTVTAGGLVTGAGLALGGGAGGLSPSGSLNIPGSITAEGAVKGSEFTANGISLTTHVHGETGAGGGTTTPPK